MAKPRTEKWAFELFCQTKSKAENKTKIDGKKFHIFYDEEGPEHDHPDTLVLKAYKLYEDHYKEIMKERKGELMGLIYLYKNKYYFTDVMLSKQGGFRGELLTPDNLKQGSKMIATFHTHPASGYGKYAPLHFSAGDVKTAICRKDDVRIGYLRTPDGDVRRIDRELYNISILDGTNHFPGKSICPKRCPCLKAHSTFPRIQPEEYYNGVLQDYIFNEKKNKRKNNAAYKSIRNRFKRCRQPPLQKKNNQSIR